MRELESHRDWVRDRFFQREILYIYIFSGEVSKQFFIVLTPRNRSSHISDVLDRVGSGQLGHPPNSNISHLYKMGWYNRSIIIQVHSLRFFKVIHTGKWAMWPCEHIYYLGAYKVMYLLGIHNSLTPKLLVNSYNHVSLYPRLFSHILMYTLNPSKLYTTQQYKCIHNYISYKSNITNWPWTRLYQWNSKKKSFF